MDRPHHLNRLTLAAAAVSLAVSATASASGFRLPENSIAGLGTSNALVANSTELGALTYNPAGMGFHKKSGAVAGLTDINLDLKVDPQGGTPTDSTGKDNIAVPSGYFMGQLDHGWAWGLGISVPFGLETRWPAGTFPSFAGPLGAAAPEHSKLEVLNFNPNVSKRISPNTSVAFGVDFYNAKSMIFNTQAYAIDGTGEGTGFNLAVLHKAGAWSFGGSYRSQVDVDINGQVSGAPATTTITFPWMLQVGAQYQATPALALEFDVERTGWSKFDKLVIKAPVAATTITSTNNWNDSNAYRFGGTYQIAPRTQLRFGLALDKTPQGDSYYSARVPDADRKLYSIGIAQDMGGWSLEAGYMRVEFDDRTIDSSVPYPRSGTNTDPNGTSAYNGKYTASVNLYGLGVSTTF